MATEREGSEEGQSTDKLGSRGGIVSGILMVILIGIIGSQSAVPPSPFGSWIQPVENLEQ